MGLRVEAPVCDVVTVGCSPLAEACFWLRVLVNPTPHGSWRTESAPRYLIARLGGDSLPPP